VPSDGFERRARDEADQLAAVDGDAGARGLGADESNDAMQRRRLYVGHVARDLNTIVVELQAENAQRLQSAAALASVLS